MGIELWKTVAIFFLNKTKHHLYDSAVAPYGIYSNQLKTYVHIQAGTRVLIVALFITAKTWMQSRCPSVGEWINKLWHTQIMEYCSVLKGNEPSSHEKTWRSFKCILLSKEENLKRPSTVWSPLCGPHCAAVWEKQNCGDRKRSVVVRLKGRKGE